MFVRARNRSDIWFLASPLSPQGSAWRGRCQQTVYLTPGFPNLAEYKVIDLVAIWQHRLLYHRHPRFALPALQRL